MPLRLASVLIGCITLGVATSGCVLGSSRASSALDEIVPSPSQRLACGNEGIDGPSGRSCSFIVKGSETQVLMRVARSLESRGYKTSCTDSSLGAGGIEVVGAQPGLRVTVDVIPAGFALMGDGDAIFFPPGTSIGGEKVEIPSDSVGVDIDASEYQTTFITGTSCEDAIR